MFAIQEIHDGLDFSAEDDGMYSFGIFSLKFSADGRELVAGSSGDSIYVYDLEANKRSLKILAHTVQFYENTMFLCDSWFICMCFCWIVLTLYFSIKTCYDHDVFSSFYQMLYCTILSNLFESSLVIVYLNAV